MKKKHDEMGKAGFEGKFGRQRIRDKEGVNL